MFVPYGLAILSHSNSSRVRWICPNCSVRLRRTGNYQSTWMNHERLLHGLRSTISYQPKRSCPNSSRPLSLRLEKRNATGQAAYAVPEDEVFLKVYQSVHWQEKNAGKRPPYENRRVVQRAGNTIPIRAKLQAWQEDFVRKTSPEYVDQTLGGDVSRIWQQSYANLHLERGDGIFANDTRPADEQEEEEQEFLSYEGNAEYQNQMVEGVLDNWGDSTVLRPGDLVATRWYGCSFLTAA